MKALLHHITRASNEMTTSTSTYAAPSEALRAADKRVVELKCAVYAVTQNREILTSTNLPKMLDIAKQAGLNTRLMDAYNDLWDVQATEHTELVNSQKITLDTIAMHTFDSTREAYNATQCRDDIKKGDILLIPSEGVVGIADTWPFAVSSKRGELHGIDVTGWDSPYMLKFAGSIALGRKLWRDTMLAPIAKQEDAQ